MGTRIIIDGTHPFEATEYSVTEEASPLAAGDTSGSVGTITFTIPVNDPYNTPAPVSLSPEFTEDPLDPGTFLGEWVEDPLDPGTYLISPGLIEDPLDPGTYIANVAPVPNVPDPLTLYGPQWFEGRSVSLADSRRGSTVGTVSSVSQDESAGTIALTCISRLGDLNVYNVQALPFVGTLGAAFEYYLTLAGITTDFLVDSSITSRPVVLPGWEGELWLGLKQLAIAQDCDISLVSGIILLRPVRVRVAERGRTTNRSRTVGTGTLAQSVEVYLYESRAITDELIYPPGGWTPEVEVLNVNAGETAEYTLDLSASVSSISAPTAELFVSQEHKSSSVYTIVADDGLPVDPALWAAQGGRVDISVNRDTRSLKVVLVGARGVPVVSGGVSRSFSLALASDNTGSRYSTLRILGTGVAFTRTKQIVRTGVPASRTATEVGETIDNPFITTVNSLWSAGTRAAKRYSGAVPSLSGSVVSINRRGDTGAEAFVTYGDMQAALVTELGASPTYDDVQTYYTVTESLPSYGAIRDFWEAQVTNAFENQAFGNVAGARIWDAKSRRWYRIRAGATSSDAIQFGPADDDLLYDDVQSFLAGATYGDVQTTRTALAMTYHDDYLIGLYNG